MRTLQVVLSILSVLMVLFTLICGFWIHTSNDVADPASSINFHMWLGVATFVVVLATTIVTLVRK